MIIVCPECNQTGRKVKRVTLESLLRPDRRSAIGQAQYYVCTTPGCETVYFAHGNGGVFLKSDLTVRFGLKETSRPRTVCYCFDHTFEETHDEIRRTGRSTVLDSIKEDMKGPGCRCEYTNPLGACCLSTVQAVVEEGFRLAGKPAAGADVGDGDADDCCARAPMEIANSEWRIANEESGRSASSHSPFAIRHSTFLHHPPSNRSGVLAAGGSMAAAMLSSACCWLPLLLLAFGASAAGVAGFFEKWRMPFIAVAVVFLGFGFYVQYRRQPQCGDGSCPAPSKGLRRFNRSILWLATTFVVAMILFPNYIQHFLGGSDAAAAVNAVSGTTWFVPIEGMTCEGCAAVAAKSLSEVEGVARAEVSYAERRALVTVSATENKVRRRIVAAVEALGFKARAENIRELP